VLARRAADRKSVKQDLERIWRAGVEACLPERVLPPHLPDPPRGRTIVLAVGKAALGMARVAEAGLAGEIEDVAVVPHGSPLPLDRHPGLEPGSTFPPESPRTGTRRPGHDMIAVLEAGHPIPDESSVAAAGSLLGLARSAGPDDLVLVLLSGGDSALACLPGAGLSLAEKQDLTAALLRSGATTGEINCVRRHLSRIKGGRLAEAAAPARLLTLAMSDVEGDRPEDIGSGPTAPDPTRIEDARTVLERYGIEAPQRGWSETPKSTHGDFRIVARAADALAAAAEEARRLGYAPQILGECYGEAREVGRGHAALALAAPPGTALISGGEPTVRVIGPGRGGRNHEYALAAALALAGRGGIIGLTGDSDGIDGTSGAAGAFFEAIGEGEARAALQANDTGGWFRRRGAQLVTGPTGTNVNDLRVILVR
jgi:hydroxypyruvate reductase